MSWIKKCKSSVELIRCSAKVHPELRGIIKSLSHEVTAAERQA